jgi:hypothetical protein
MRKQNLRQQDMSTPSVYVELNRVPTMNASVTNLNERHALLSTTSDTSAWVHVQVLLLVQNVKINPGARPYLWF